MAILLWGIMMVLALVTVVFMWVFQIHFMERNYIESNISEVQAQVEAVLDDLATEDLAYNEQLLSSLSHAADGKLLIVNGSGQLIDLYTLGHPIDLKENCTDILVWERIANGGNYAAILAAVLSKLFTSPILTIKKTVDALAAGDLTAKPGLKRRDEIGQLSCSVEKLGQALQRVDVLRKEVIANVSHELRSPLALIGGYAEMVRVVNPGEPIPEEERAIIWERYQRSQHQAGRRQGTGIGLSIVKTILDTHGMTYGVDCRDGLTCFWFRYPANPSSSNQS